MKLVIRFLKTTKTKERKEISRNRLLQEEQKLFNIKQTTR